MKSLAKPIAAAIAMAFAAPGMAATWTFDLPATGLESISAPYPNIATLTLTDVAGGTQFVLDPNEANPGYSLDTPVSVISRLDYVYSGPALTDVSFQYDSGAAIQSFSYLTNPNNVDAGYLAADEHIVVDFFNNPQDAFQVTETSTWTVLGATVDDFVNTYATANNKPSPIFGVISINPFSNPDQTPNTSNWVAEIPEPETYAMLLAGLGMLGFVGKRRATRPTDISREGEASVV